MSASYRWGAVLACGLALQGTALWGAEYTVAQRDPSASDENAGSAEKPWKTIGRSLSQLKPGDTLHVRAGVYRESVMLPRQDWKLGGVAYPAFRTGSNVAETVRFLAAPGEDVVIKGSDVVTGWTVHTNAIWVRDGWTYNSQQVFCDGEILQQMGGVMVSVLQEPWIGEYKDKGFQDLKPGSFFYDRERQKLFVWLKDGGDPNARLMEAGARPFLFTVDGQYVHIVGFKMTHGDVGAMINWPSVFINGSQNVIEDCEITWCDYIALSLGGDNNTARRCKLNHNGNAGMCGWGWGNRVLDCQLAWNNTRHWSSGWGAGGMKIIPSAHGWIISGCLVEHNLWSDGIWFDTANANVTIQNCIMRYNDGSGIHYEISERAIIRNNIAYENKGRGIYLSNSSRSVVLHNLCYRNGQSGIVAHGVNRPGGFSTDPETGYEPACDNVVWGNILMDNCNPELCPRDSDHTGRGWSLRPELILPDPKIKSNAGCVSDYNLFFRSDGRPIPFWENWGAGVYGSLKEWQEQTGQDRHSLVIEPLFVNAAERDFRPAKGSPAIQYVRPLMGIQYDRDGRQRLYRDTFITAGPYEAPDELIKPAPAATNVPPKVRAVALPGSVALAGEGPLGVLAEALKALPAQPMPDGRPGIELKGIPFAPGAPPGAVVLDRKHPRALIPVNARVRDLYILHALPGTGAGVQSRCMILRQDGIVIQLRWEAGKNIAPSVGAWSGTVTNELSPPTYGYMLKEDQKQATDVAWEGQAGGTPVRLFLSHWRNLNEWLPVKEMEWLLADDSATVVILGITGRMLE
jgi:parallel beta-helix repeat protein